MGTGILLLRRFWYAVPIVLLAIALLATRGTLADVKRDRDAHKAFGNVVTQVTRDAAGSPRLVRDQVPAQIAALGRSVGALRAGLGRCNASARAAAEADARLRREAEQAAQEARQRARASEGVAARLRASAAQAPPPGGSCEPSATVREIWP